MRRSAVRIAKGLFYSVLYVITVPLFAFYNLFQTLAVYARRPVEFRDTGNLNLVIPYEPGERSGASNGIRTLQEDLKESFNLKTIPLFDLEPGGGQLRRLLSDLITSALPMPRHCRPFVLSPGSVRGQIQEEHPVFVEFVSGALFLVAGGKPRNMVILRDHENLCRRLMMDFRREKGLEKVSCLARYLSCYMFLYNVYLKSDRIVTLTGQDAEYIERKFPMFKEKVVHIPRSFRIDGENYGRPDLNRGRKEMMYVANFYHQPNIDGLLWFLSEAAPYLEPGFILHLVGLDEPLDTLEMETHNLVIFRHGFVEDIEAEFNHVGIAISPAISGSGIRTKNLFLAAKGKAIVTTELGNEDIEFVHGREAIICKSGRQMAEEINRLVGRPEEILRLGKNAFDKVKIDYDRGALMSRYKSEVFC